MAIEWLGGAMVVLAAAGLALWQRRPQRPARATETNTDSGRAGTSQGISKTDNLSYDDAATVEINSRLHELAFGPLNDGATLHSDHLLILKQVREAIGSAIGDRQYFPRRPMVIPQLLQATRQPEGSSGELVDIIIQDPVLTGDVLRLANSAYYRPPGEAVGTLERAVALLGTDGLRAVVSASVLQPVFRVPRGCFDQFSTVVWDQALKSAMGAQACARRARNCDAFTAHLLGLLTAIGRIVLFRLTVEKYAQIPGLHPEPQIFVSILEEHADRTALAIARDWDLDPALCAAIEEHIARLPVNRMGPLARALYFGRLCGTCALLFEHGTPSEPRSLALQKGLDEKDFDFIWQAVLPSSGED